MDKKEQNVYKCDNLVGSLLTIKSQYDKIQALGQLTQLGECLLDVEKVSGSSPLLPTKASQARKCLVLFLIMHDMLA